MTEPKRRPLGERNAQVDPPQTINNNRSTDKENNRKGEAAGKLAVTVIRDHGNLERPIKERSYRISDFDFGALIGSGKYGRVYYARDRLHDRDVALKRLDAHDIHADRSKHVESEIQIQSHLEHPNVTRLYGVFTHSDKLFLVLEFAREGSLFDLFQKVGRMNERCVVQSMIKALVHLHSHGIVHRDIKPENILIGDDGMPKLADFGWSILSKARRYTMCGTMDYVAPEMLTKAGYDHRVDIWSLGVLCYELLIGDPPFADKDVLRTSERIRKLDYTFPDQPIVSDAARDFIGAVNFTMKFPNPDVVVVGFEIGPGTKNGIGRYDSA